MTYWSIYASIKNNTVMNVAVFDPNGAFAVANNCAHELYGDGAFAVDVTQIPVQTGDVYVHGQFYRNGSEILPLPTDEEQIASLDNHMGTAESDITDIQIALVAIYEELGGING